MRNQNTLLRATLGATLGAAVALIAVACARKNETPTNGMASTAATPATADTGTKSGMGMAAMGQIPPAESAILDSVQSHINAHPGMTPAQLASDVPAHSTLVSNMLTQIDSDTRTMSTPPNTALTATIDSVKKDISKLPTVPRAQLKETIATDDSRITRLIQLRKAMASGL